MINQWLSFSREFGRHSDLRRSDLDLIGAYVLIVPREKWILSFISIPFFRTGASAWRASLSSQQININLFYLC